MSMASFSMEMIFFGLEVLKDGFVQSTLGLNLEEVFKKPWKVSAETSPWNR